MPVIEFGIQAFGTVMTTEMEAQSQAGKTELNFAITDVQSKGWRMQGDPRTFIDLGQFIGTHMTMV